MQPLLIREMILSIVSASRHIIRDFGEVSQLASHRKEPFLRASRRRIEESMEKSLQDKFPRDSILMQGKHFFMKEGDLFQESLENAGIWVFDALSGQENFAHAYPFFALSLAFIQENTIKAAVVYDPLQNESFWACRGSGCFLNQTRLRVDSRSISPVVFDCHLPDAVRHKLRGEANLRTCDSPALGMAYVAAGRYDAFATCDGSFASLIAGVLLVKEAGGFVTDMAGGQPQWTGAQGIVAGHERIHQQILKLLKRAS